MTTTPIEPTKPKPRTHTIITDRDERLHGLTDSPLIAEQNKLRTPAALKLQRDADRLKCRPKSFTVEGGTKKFDEWARVDVEGAVDESSLRLQIEVVCNPEYMCEPHDLVPIYLERGTDDFVFMIEVLEPTKGQNYFKIEAVYPLRELIGALGLNMTIGAKPFEVIRAEFAELGVSVQWLADTTGVNGPNHVSGGVFEKGGSGKVLLRPRTPQHFAETVSVRNTEWNMAERLTSARGRPVYLAFESILASGKEMATTLEAESEYQVEEGILNMIIGRMESLPEQGFELTKSVKTYTDYYFDIQPTCPFLANRIVLRRRSVPTDPQGTYLFTLKGRTHTEGNESIRLAAQVNLIEQGLDPDILRTFLCDTVHNDNAFAIVLRDVLEDRGLGHLLTEKWALECVMTVVSERHKYSLKFPDATVIEFSADKARCGKAELFSFELGVGHPGLTAGNTATALSMGKRIAQFNSNVGLAPTPMGAKKFEAKARPITRPFHIPQDLTNRRLFQKADFLKYLSVREWLITEIFGLDIRKLTPGGNKASVLAQMLGIGK